jgi:hypothetical protein
MSAPKNCSAIENDLPLFVGGDLGARSRAEVEEHLQHCQACSQAVGRLAAARTALREGLALGEMRVPDLWAGVRARLVESGTIHAPAPRAAAEVAARPRSMPRWFPISAAAALLFAFGLWAMQRDVQPLKPQKPITPQPVATNCGLRRLGAGESALSDSAITIEALQEEARLEALRQPAGAQTASQHRGMH